MKLTSVPVVYSYCIRIITEKNAHLSLCNALDEKIKQNNTSLLKQTAFLHCLLSFPTSIQVGHNWSDLAAAAAGVKKWNLGVDTWEFYHQSKVSSLSSPSSLFTWVLSLRLSAPKANSRCFHIWPSCQAAQRGWQEASSTFFQPGFLRKSLFQYFISVQFFLPSFQCLLLILRTLTFDVQISVIVSWLNWYIVTFWSLCNPFCF